ncbi:PhnD/SsuA/transferrin family substrate-binding protein [Maridesulfovibrio ferrireducens]|uniref:PhnD/SsuA/transferrin family substrate-binding protein n=1 Tax=Maridesulfovibrio ferrireducens TaxID=246191 RepID=UPI001A203958|nr:PhnD/SsuA/transferrin family substrate-binding protein [Maridesulfovibrio ferrireducens]MBI9112442.1 PhnD/SsuA/transferrin family substrate-binding protein [Maridesulfovibrio ferrireducens]
MLRKILAITFILILSVAGAVSSAGAAESFKFVIIEPGQPGTSADAQPVMDSLAEYVSEKLGKPATGVYFNELEPALKYLDENKPIWGICGLTFFTSYSDKYIMTPIASTLPQGLDKDVWRILAPCDGPDSVKDIKGTVFGSMLYTPESRKILFKKDEVENQLVIEGTSRPLSKLRWVNKGKAAGVCLNAVQYSVLSGTDRFSGVKVVYESGKLPNSPVVWFGKVTDDSFRLQAILLDMKDDPAAASLLKLLQTNGFGPADKELK